MDEEMMEAVNNQAHQMSREGLKDPSTETKDIDQCNGLFVDNEHADEETLAMVKLINAINQMYREAVRDPATETKDRDLSIDIQYTSEFIDDERVEDLAKKYKEKFSRMRPARTYNID